MGECRTLPSNVAYPVVTRGLHTLETHPMTLADSDALIARLPHRPPFRFVDAVGACEPAVSVVARYRVTGEEAFLAGHFQATRSSPA